jgi:hypothetical protein
MFLRKNAIPLALLSAVAFAAGSFIRMKAMAPRNNAIAITLLAIFTFAALSYILNRRFGELTQLRNATYAGARDALDRLADWAKWMSGIQTASLASIGLLAKGRTGAEDDPAVVATVLLMGAALFCSAWVLSSLPSIALRITPNVREGRAAKRKPPVHATRYDVYEQPLYGWLGRLRLSYMLMLQHWLWAAGLITFAWFLLRFPSLPAAAVHVGS